MFNVRSSLVVFSSIHDTVFTLISPRISFHPHGICNMCVAVSSYHHVMMPKMVGKWNWDLLMRLTPERTSSVWESNQINVTQVSVRKREERDVAWRNIRGLRLTATNNSSWWWRFRQSKTFNKLFLFTHSISRHGACRCRRQSPLVSFSAAFFYGADLTCFRFMCCVRRADAAGDWGKTLFTGVYEGWKMEDKDCSAG